MVKLETYKKLLKNNADDIELCCGIHICMCSDEDIDFDDFMSTIKMLIDEGHTEYARTKNYTDMEC